jgi:hypothetical protein
MQKSKLDKFIQKYNLGGNVNQVKWVSKDNKLSTSFVTPDKSLMGSVNVDNFTFEDVELGVYTTDQLMKLLNVLDDDVKLKVTKFGDRSVSLKAENGSVSFDYTLSDLSIIPDTPSLKRLPTFGTKIKIDTKFINTFIKGKTALSETETFTVINTGDNLEIIIGYSSTNTNRVNIPVETETNDLNEPVSFSANLFKDVLVANKECSSATLEVSNDGLARINFKVDDYDSTYHIVATQGVD